MGRIWSSPTGPVPERVLATRLILDEALHDADGNGTWTEVAHADARRDDDSERLLWSWTPVSVTGCWWPWGYWSMTAACYGI
jgi:hypothetical protein